MMDGFLNKLVLSGLISTTLLGISSVSYAEDLSQVEIDIKNSNGDRAGASNVVFKVYNVSEITSCNCVAFRLDDIQDYWINDVQM